MKRFVFFMLLVFAFSFIYAAGSQSGDLNDYDGQTGYSTNYNGNSEVNAPTYCDLITFNVLSGTATDNGDGSGNISLHLSQIPQGTRSFLLLRKVNDFAWETVLHGQINAGAITIGGTQSFYADWYSLFITGDSLSYKMVFYSSRSTRKLLGISNTIEYVYQ